MAALFYADGLRFSCAQCSDCCRHEPGYVYLRKSDIPFLEKALKIKYDKLVDAYCRWVPSGDGVFKLSLKEKPNYDCIFWEKGCVIYENRPLQCRSFPFWPAILDSEKTWNNAARACPGMNKGALHSFQSIKNWLEQSSREKIITKGAG